jgi:lipoprotein-anchoring transpeptidase ErfK/SrfK
MGFSLIAALALVASAPPAEPAQPEGFLVARVASSAVVIHARPGGAAVRALGRQTEFGSPQTLTVVRERGKWLGVVSSTVANGQIGWVKRSGLRYRHVTLKLEADLSRRTLTVKRGDTALRRIRIDIGAATSQTPVGRYAVTDKLPGGRFSTLYGCCILALSGHQGSRRLAIHGTPSGSAPGYANSEGCLHAKTSDLRYLMRLIPLGTPVFVHP